MLVISCLFTLIKHTHIHRLVHTCIIGQRQSAAKFHSYTRKVTAFKTSATQFMKREGILCTTIYMGSMKTETDRTLLPNRVDV
jgi:hypothetical protein